MKNIVGIDNNSTLFCPNIPFITERNKEFIFYSNDVLTAVHVNQVGAFILKIIQPGDTICSLADRISLLTGYSKTDILKQLVPFIKKMVQNGYLCLSNNHPDKLPYNFQTKFKPIQLYLHVTHNCNQNCIYCYNKEYRNQNKKKSLTYMEKQDLLSQSSELGVQEVIYTGGEPLLDKRIFDIANFGKKLGMYNTLLTNGILIKRLGAHNLTDSFDRIIISFDSWVESEYELLRGKGNFSEVVKSIQAVSSIDSKKVTLRPVITSVNLESISRFPEWADKKLNCKSIIPTVYQPNSLEEIEKLNLTPDFNEFEMAMLKFDSYYKNISKNKSQNTALSQAKIGCGAGSQIISIDASGNAYPCQSLHFSEFYGGNILQESLREIGSSPAFRRVSSITVNDIPKCCNCNIKYLCGGGCRALSYTLYKDLYAYNENFCDFLRLDSEDRLWDIAASNNNYEHVSRDRSQASSHRLLSC